MSREIKTGGPAFPSGEQYRNGAGDLCGKSSLYEGMTLRDYFAAKAMQGILAHLENHMERFLDLHDEDIAKFAYRQADAMLEARGNK